MRIPCESCHLKFKLDSNLVKPTGTLVRCSKCRAVFRVYPPDVVKRRKHTRVKTQNLISYFSFNKNHKLISHGLGIALDISKGGILLETPYSIESSFLVLTATDKLKNLIEVKGRLIYSKKSSSGTYLCGIEFFGNDERIKDFISKLILEYNVQRNNLFITLKKKLYRKNSRSIPPQIHTTHSFK
jgi:predicted Zn finger-like uncharacterized protein